MKKGFYGIVMLAAVLLLGSCGESGKMGTAQTAEPQKEKGIVLPFEQMVERAGDAVGGTFVYGYVSDTPWKGVFNIFLYEDNPTFMVAQPMWGGFIKVGPNGETIDGGYCNVTFDREAKAATMHINPKLTWSDGVPVTADDLIFVYESVCHPDYTGVRYDSEYENVVGAAEYHKGEVKSISGLKKIDDKTLQITFKDFSVAILWGAGMPTNPEPAHYLKDIPLAEMAAHDRVRKNPLSYGPFMINSMVEGDTIEYVPNPHWFGRKVSVDKVIVKRIAPTSVSAAIKAGEIDVVQFPTSLYDQFVQLTDDGHTAKDENGKAKMKLDNIDIVNYVERSYSYLGFKLGTWNNEKGECESFADGGKFKDKALRQAIGYAMDNDGIHDIYYHGLRVTANSFIPPAFASFYDPSIKGYSYNPEKAKQLLDEAGYKDTDGDGFRETPDGKPLKINFLSMSGPEIAEPIANYYIQNWKDVGLNVALNGGRLIEFNAFYEKLQKDDPAVEMYSAAWGTGSNPEPSGLYSKAAQFNLCRWVDEKNEALLKDIASDKAFDENFRQKAYRAWNEHILEEAPCIPFAFRMSLIAVNKRVKIWDERPKTDWLWCDVALIKDKPVVNTMN